MKALVGAFNQEKALVGGSAVIVKIQNSSSSRGPTLAHMSFIKLILAPTTATASSRTKTGEVH